jgi:hypothetical protein
LIITFVFEKNANFFAENWKKSQKIAIITLTPESQCDDFKNIFAEKNCDQFGIQNTAKSFPKHEHNIGFKGKTPIFSPKIIIKTSTPELWNFGYRKNV